MTPQLPCKQEGWISLPMILVWLLLSWHAFQSQLMYPQNNFKAHKDHQCHCKRQLYGQCLWHPGRIDAPRKYWDQQSKLARLALLSAEERLQFRGGRQSPEHSLYSSKVRSCLHSVQLTSVTAISSCLFCRGMNFPASSLSLWGFTSSASWSWHIGYYNSRVDWFWTQPLYCFWWGLDL